MGMKTFMSCELRGYWEGRTLGKFFAFHFADTLPAVPTVDFFLPSHIDKDHGKEAKRVTDNVVRLYCR